MTPNKTQLANILNHSVFLRNLPLKDGNRFNMQTFASLNNGEDLELYDPYSIANFPKPKDGFLACALGWSVHNPDLPKPIVDELWEDYSNRIFGLNKNEPFNINYLWEDKGHFSYSNAFDFCFYSGWEEDEHAAADRLLQVYNRYKKETTL